MNKSKHTYHDMSDDVSIYESSAMKIERLVYDYIQTFFVNGCDIDINIWTVYIRDGQPFKKGDEQLTAFVFYTGKIGEKQLKRKLNEFPLNITDGNLSADVFDNAVPCHFIPVKLSDAVDYGIQIKNYVSKLSGINEDATYALSDSGKQSDAFSYEIKPLNTTLSQPGNDVTGLNNNNDSFKHFPGDTVKGYCPFDKKWHKGMIKYLYYDGENQKMPKYAYIQDFGNENTIPVIASTLKSEYHIPDFQFKVPNGPYDYYQYRPIMEKKIYEAIDTGIQKALVLPDEMDSDISVKFRHKHISNSMNMINSITDSFKSDPSPENFNAVFNYHNETGYMYMVNDIYELIKIFDILRIYGLPLDITWINTENALTFILDDDMEIPVHNYDGQSHVKFIKYKNIKGCDHPILLHTDLKIDKWLNWNEKPIRKRVFNYSDCIIDNEKAKNDFDGYGHTYNNANIKNNDIVYAENIYRLSNYDNFPALKYALSINEPGYEAYVPAIGEMTFLGICNDACFTDYILKLVNSKKELNLCKDMWYSSTEYSEKYNYGINANPRYPSKLSKTLEYGANVLPLFKKK